MIIHIVSEREKISDILNAYNVSIDDLKSNNLHITDFINLKPGMKIKIPSINSGNIQVLNETEPLMTKYYDIKVDELPKEEKKEVKPFRGLNFKKPHFNNLIRRRQIYPHYNPNDDQKE